MFTFTIQGSPYVKHIVSEIFWDEVDIVCSDLGGVK